jgi:hypothetical protein
MITLHTVTATSKITNEKVFNSLLPHIKPLLTTNNTLDAFIEICNSDDTLEQKCKIVADLKRMLTL